MLVSISTTACFPSMFPRPVDTMQKIVQWLRPFHHPFRAPFIHCHARPYTCARLGGVWRRGGCILTPPCPDVEANGTVLPRINCDSRDVHVQLMRFAYPSGLDALDAVGLEEVQKWDRLLAQHRKGERGWRWTS